MLAGVVNHISAPVHKTGVKITEDGEGLGIIHAQEIPPSWSDCLAELQRSPLVRDETSCGDLPGVLLAAST